MLINFLDGFVWGVCVNERKQNQAFKKHDTSAILRFCLASRTWITITLWQTISAINLISIPSLNFQPNMAKHKCNCFPSLKPYRVEMKKGEEKVFNFCFIYTRRKIEIFHLKSFWHFDNVKSEVFRCTTGFLFGKLKVYTCSNGWESQQFSWSLGFSLYSDDRNQASPYA